MAPSVSAIFKEPLATRDTSVGEIQPEGRSSIHMIERWTIYRDFSLYQECCLGIPLKSPKCFWTCSVALMTKDCEF